MELPLAEEMAETIYDAAIIGGGPAGYTAAIRGAEYGLKVALIEQSGKLEMCIRDRLAEVVANGQRDVVAQAEVALHLSCLLYTSRCV